MMTAVKKYFGCTVLVLVMLVGVFMGGASVRAADQSNQPTFLFSWHAVGGAPAWYAGKVLPTYQSSVVLSFIMLDGNRPVSLDGQAVKWFVNGNLVAHGVGMGSILFVNKNVFGGGQLDVKVSVQSIDASTGNNGIQSGYFTVPIVSPQVVITKPPFVNTFSPGQTVVLGAVPFFFTLPPNALSFSWTVNGSAAQSAGDSSHLSIKINQQAAASSQLVGVTVLNAAMPGIESGSDTYNFSIR